MNIYLAGPIHGKSDFECNAWRSVARSYIESAGHTAVDPMGRDYRGQEDDFADEIVLGDQEAIQACDALLVNANTPTWGTAMEVMHGYVNGKQVIAFCDAESISPWLRYHTTAIFYCVDQAAAGMVKNSIEGLR